MTATEELRHLLDERGVEWRGGLPTETIVRKPIDALYVERSNGMMHVYFRSYLTPEQAIAATLDAGTCHRRPHINLTIGDNFLKQSGWDCSECGCGLDLPVIARYCPNCGRKVVDE